MDHPNPSQVEPKRGEGVRFLRRLPLVLLAIVTAVSVWYSTAPWRLAWERRVEKAKCVERLREFHQAFTAYHRDHGDYPKSPLLLYPRYVKSLHAFACPAYRRGLLSVDWSKSIRVGGRTALETYFFPYLALQHPGHHLRLERVPMMVCTVHAQFLYEDNERQQVNDKAGFERRHGIPEILVLRRNGSVERVNDFELPHHGVQYVEIPSMGKTGPAVTDAPGGRDTRVARD